MRKQVLPAAILVLLLGVGAALVFAMRSPYAPQTSSTDEGPNDAVTDDEYDPPIPPAVAVSPSEAKQTPGSMGALGGLDVLIADRGNNRIIEVTPDKRIVWEYDFALPRAGLGADDAFFIQGGNQIVAGLEEMQEIQILDMKTKRVTWRYGVPGRSGSADGLLHTPDDPYVLPNGDVVVADISNCRIIEIAPDKSIVRQYGITGECGNSTGELDKPNGDTPLLNGHLLVSNIVGHTLLELDQDWKPAFSMTLPLNYPSDPQMTLSGNILVAGYTDPGEIIEMGKDGKIVWQEADTSGPNRLKRPSLAIELPNGNILANDDENHRVIVIDKASHAIVWQYGVTGKPGRGDGQLNLPDGVDVIGRTEPPPVSLEDFPVRSVGSVTRHAASFPDATVTLKGYVLKTLPDIIIVSDEKGGTVGSFDLPVAGPGIDGLDPNRPYLFTGVYTDAGVALENGNHAFLELLRPPEPVSP